MKELVNIQSELNCPKNQRNTFGNYSYRNCEDIMEALKPLLKKNNCILMVSDTVELIGDRYYIKATAKLYNSDGTLIENTAYAREAESKKGMDLSQISGATSSYARKYCLNGLFLIDDVKDADTDEHTTASQKTSKPSGGTFKKGGVNTPTKPQSSPKTPAKSSVGVPKPSPKPKPKLG